MNKKVKSVMLLVTATVIWGLSFVAQTTVNPEELGTFGFNAFRYLLGFFSMLPIILIFEREEQSVPKMKKTFIYGAITGVVLFLASVLQMYGIGINKSAGKSGFLTGLYIVLVPFLNFAARRKRVSVFEWIAAVVATVGLFLLSVTDGFDNINKGDIAIILGAVFWAGHILVIDRFVDHVSPIKYSCIQYLTASLCSFIFAAFTENITVSAVMSNLVAVAYAGVMSTGVAFTCQIIGQKGLNPNFSAIILSCECVWSAVFGALFLQEKMSVKGYLGCILMFLGILLSQIKIKRK